MLKKFWGGGCGSNMAYRITKKSTTEKTPFVLVYGLTNSLPIYFQLPAMKMLQEYETEDDSMPNRINQIIELDENRRKALDHSIRNQDKIKRTFDKSSRPRPFEIGDTVLLWDKRKEKLGKHKKFDSLWMGPYIIYGVAGTNSFLLNTMEGEKLLLPVNRKQFKLFFNNDI